jgi:RNA polymerase sigma-70 factor (ECF subfamily)
MMLGVLTEAEFTARAGVHRRELHVHCYRMLGSFEEAEDLVQETLLRAWRRRDDLERDEWFRAWLYKIATNACLDAIRAKGRRPPSDPTPRELPWLQPYPDSLLEPGDLVVDRETIELAFLVMIQQLPPRQRAVLILRDVLGWSAAEAGEVLDLGVAAVNSALQRARETLHRHLPADRREDWASPAASAAERDLLAGFIATHESGDVDAALELIAEDIRVTMPPLPMLYEGRDAIAGLMRQAAEMGEWRLVPVAANRSPAAASYFRAPGDGAFRAFKLDVLRVDGGRIAEITTFGSQAFPAFGLAEVL